MQPLEPGAIFARDFKIVRPLARGGMGSVYEVEQVSTSKTRALKVLHAQLAGDPKIRQRFEQEARVAARIESDHIVDVVAAGIEEPGTPWLVMEFLKGTDLAAHLNQHGPRPVPEVLEIFRQIGHALAAAHRAGLVHRDLKLENIFLAESRRDGAPFTAKVLDFGIAKALESAPGRATQAMGTPYWMAPEQCEDSKLIAPATDVWALGLIAFTLLTGACYWRAAREKDSAVAGLLMEMTTLPLDPPSVRAREYGRDHLLPPGFDAWFSRCVTRPIDQRYRDAAECVAALIPVLSQPALPNAQTIPQAPSAPSFAAAPMVAPPMAAPPVSAPPMSAPMAPSPAMAAPVMAAVPMSAPPMALPPSAPPFQAGWSPAVAPQLQPQLAVPETGRRAPWLIIIAVVAVSFSCVGAFLAMKLRSSHHESRVMVDEVPHTTDRDGQPSQSVMTPMPVMTPTPPVIPMAPDAGLSNGLPSLPHPANHVGVDLAGVQPVPGGAATTATAAQIERVLHTRTPAVESCVRATVTRDHGNFGGMFVVTFDVADGGALTRAQVEEIDSRAFDLCVASALRRTPYPRGVGGTYQATYRVRQ